MIALPSLQFLLLVTSFSLTQQKKTFNSSHVEESTTISTKGLPTLKSPETSTNGNDSYSVPTTSEIPEVPSNASGKIPSGDQGLLSVSRNTTGQQWRNLLNRDRCRVTKMWKTFSHSLCVSKTVLVNGCEGKCKSFVLPTMKAGQRHSYFHERCTCCRPAKTRVGRIVVNCPKLKHGPKQRTVKIATATACVCRPCVYTDL